MGITVTAIQGSSPRKTAPIEGLIPIICLVPRAGKMKEILCFDWLPE